MNVIQLAILTILSEEERSVNELREILGVERRRIVKNIRILERKGYIEKKTYLGDGDIIFNITESGLEQLYKNYIFLRDLIKEMEISVCTRFDC